MEGLKVLSDDSKGKTKKDPLVLLEEQGLNNLPLKKDLKIQSKKMMEEEVETKGLKQQPETKVSWEDSSERLLEEEVDSELLLLEEQGCLLLEASKEEEETRRDV